MTYDPHAFDGLGVVGRSLARTDREAHPLTLEHPRPPKRATIRRDPMDSFEYPWFARWIAHCDACDWTRRFASQSEAIAALDRHFRSRYYHRPLFELNNVPLIGRLAGYRDGLEIG